MKYRDYSDDIENWMTFFLMCALALGLACGFLYKQNQRLRLENEVLMLMLYQCATDDSLKS